LWGERERKWLGIERTCKRGIGDILEVRCLRQFKAYIAIGIRSTKNDLPNAQTAFRIGSCDSYIEDEIRLKAMEGLEKRCERGRNSYSCD
jgi:hypothetical protein